MVDAEDRRLREDGADRVVDRRRAFAVVADRLLDDDARPFGGEPVGADPLGDRAEQIGAGREVIGARPFVLAELGLQVLPAVVAGGVDGDIVES